VLLSFAGHGELTALLARDATGGVSGRFLPRYDRFMTMRNTPEAATPKIWSGRGSRVRVEERHPPALGRSRADASARHSARGRSLSIARASAVCSAVTRLGVRAHRVGGGQPQHFGAECGQDAVRRMPGRARRPGRRGR
jgi:hypothetical protein